MTLISLLLNLSTFYLASGWAEWIKIISTGLSSPGIVSIILHSVTVADLGKNHRLILTDAQVKQKLRGAEGGKGNEVSAPRRSLMRSRLWLAGEMSGFTSVLKSYL